MPGDLLDEIAIASGLLLIVWSAVMFRRTRVWLSECVSTEGRIAGYSESEDSDGGPPYYFDTIQFTDRNGHVVEIGGSYGRQEPPTVGERVPITYHPRYPENASITGSRGVWVIPALVLVTGLVALAVGAGLHLKLIQ